MPALPSYATNAVHCLDVRPGERFTMICDGDMLAPGLAACEAAAARGAVPLLLLLPDPGRPRTAPDVRVVGAIADEADAILMWISRMFPVEVAFRRGVYDACARTGARVAFGGAMTTDILEHEMSADYAGVAERTRRFGEALAGARSVRVTAPGGTDLVVDVEGRSWIADDGRVDRPGQFANLPAGEIFIAPVEGTAEGILVVDRSIAVDADPDLVMVDEPIRITVGGGRVTAVAGGRSADAFRDLITAPGGDVIAELGIGTNDRARMQGNVMTDEKVLGSAHVAVGHNTGGYGGRNESPIHCDGCFADATIEVDGRVVIDRGQVLA